MEIQLSDGIQPKFFKLGLTALLIGHLTFLNCGASLAQETQNVMAEEAKLDYLQVSPPAYPALARERGWEGTVIVKALVEKDGACSQVAVEKSSGHALLDNSAVKAIKEWEFSPARFGNSPYAALTRIPVRFALTGKK